MGLVQSFLLFLLVFFAWIVIRDYVLYNLYAMKIPTVQPVHRWFGHAGFFMGKNSCQLFRLMVKLYENVDRVAKLWMGPIPVLLVNHPDLIQQLMNKPEVYSKPFFYKYIGLNTSLITEQRGQMWRRNRKLLNPTFSTRVLTEFVPIMDTRARKMVRTMAAFADGKSEVDILPLTAECTLEMVFSTTMGCRMEERDGQKQYVKSLEKVMECIGERILNIDRYLEPVYRLTKAYKNDKITRDFCNGFTDQIIQERKKQLADCEGKSVAEGGSQAKSLNFLDQILTILRQDGTYFPDKEISDHLYGIVAAGNDTSSLSISYTCLFLAMYPEHQAKVVDEIREVFPSRHTELNPDTLRQLEYTEMVLKETLRLCPVVPFIGRNNAEPIELDGFHIPPWQHICFNFYSLHRRKDLWGPDPERFDPDRFRPEAVKERHPYAYLPFSGGFRNCIGNRYAMNSLKIMLVRILQEFKLETRIRQADMRFRWAITAKLVGPHAVTLTKRNLYQ